MNNKLLNYVRHQTVLNKGVFNPIIISDIDGVLVRGERQIDQTLDALKRIHDNKIPFACLTNGGGHLETEKVNKLNKIFNQ
jgi:ribonucleotide monophosphatase NagD (HAD superfamily)